MWSGYALPCTSWVVVTRMLPLAKVTLAKEVANPKKIEGFGASGW